MQILAGLFYSCFLRFGVEFSGDIFVDLFFGVFLRVVVFVWGFWLVFFVLTFKVLLISYLIVYHHF